MAGPSKALTFLDLMGHVGAGTRTMANIPGAKRVPESFARAQRTMVPAEVVEQYNKEQMFGKDSKTGVARQLVQSPHFKSPSLSVSDRARMAKGKLPLEKKIVQQVVDPSHPYNPLSELTAFQDSDMLFASSIPEELYRRMYDRAEDAQRAKTVPDDVGVYDIGSINAGAGMGAMQYAALYDQLRAAGAFSGPTALTDINELRRLGNVMSYGLRHGDYENIAPVISSMNRSPQLFHRAEHADWLARPLMNILQQGRGDPIFDAAVALKPVDLADMTPDQITGVLGLKEAQLNRIAGPVREPIMLEAADPGLLRHLAVPALTNPNAYGTQKGIGPNTLGRAATVEQLIEKILAGRTGEEAAEEILNQSKRRGMNLEEGFKGRYKDGGSVVSFSGGGGVKKNVAEMAAELATKGTKTPDMSRRKFMSLGNVFDSPTSTLNLPVTATEAAKMSQDPVISAVEKIAETPVSRRQVIQGALAQGAQRMLPSAVMQPVKNMASKVVKTVMKPSVFTPTTVQGAIAHGLKRGLSDKQIANAVVKQFGDEVNHEELLDMIIPTVRNPTEWYHADGDELSAPGPLKLFKTFTDNIGAGNLKQVMRDMRAANPELYRMLKIAARDTDEEIANYTPNLTYKNRLEEAQDRAAKIGRPFDLEKFKSRYGYDNVEEFEYDD